MENLTEKQLFEEWERRKALRESIAQMEVEPSPSTSRLAIEEPATARRTLPTRSARTAKAALSMAFSGGNDASGSAAQEDEDTETEEEEEQQRRDPEVRVASAQSKDRQRGRVLWMEKLRQHMGSVVPIYREEISLYTTAKDPLAQLVNFPSLPIETWEANYQVDEHQNLVPRQPSGAYILPRVDDSDDWKVRGRLFNSAFGKTPNANKDRHKFNSFVNKVVDSLLVFTGEKPSRDFLCGFTSQVVVHYQGLWDGSPNGNAGLTHHILRRFKYLSKST